MRTESVFYFQALSKTCQKTKRLWLQTSVKFQPGEVNPGSAGPPAGCAEKHCLVTTAEPTASVLCSLALDVRVYDLT